MYYIPFDRSFLQLSNGIRHVMPSTDRKLELTAKASMAQPVSQTAVCYNGLRYSIVFIASLLQRADSLDSSLSNCPLTQSPHQRRPDHVVFINLT